VRVGVFYLCFWITVGLRAIAIKPLDARPNERCQKCQQ